MVLTVPGEDVRSVDGERRTSGRRGADRTALAVVTLLVLVAGWTHRWTSDDAFINFRVVENLLAGNGPVYNAGERVEVATSPLWLLVLTVAEALIPGTGVGWASVVLGLACTAAGVVLATLAAQRLFRTGQARFTVPFGGLVLAALPPMWDFSTSGLETGLSFGWLGASFWGLVRWSDPPCRPRAGRPRWLYVLVGLGPLVRPDLALVSALLLGWLTVAALGTWRQRVGGLLVACGLPAAFQLFRMGYYGLLIPNTAVAKESGRPLWGRGWAYVLDLFAPHLLWVPLLVAATCLVVVLPTVAWDARQKSLVVVVLSAAVLHGLYVTRVGGDFMHARLLLPSVFLVVCPVMALPLGPPRWRILTLGSLLAVGGAWAVLSALTLRPSYEGAIGASGIADERGVYAAQARTSHPVTLADRQAAVLSYGRAVRDLDRRGGDVVVGQPRTVDPGTPPLVLGPSSGGLVFSVGNAGFYGVAAGVDVRVIDQFGLTDPVAAHLEPPEPGRPGHEKVLPPTWLLGRYGAEEVPAEYLGPDTTRAGIAAARAALACGAARELLDATNAPLTWERFRDNVLGSPDRTALRIPADPGRAEAALC